MNDTLAGAIKHEHYVSSNAFVRIIDPYLNAFTQAYRNWYGKTITRTTVLMSWVNFMRAGEFNPPHTHPDCDLSSVLFIKIPGRRNPRQALVKIVKSWEIWVKH